MGRPGPLRRRSGGPPQQRREAPPLILPRGPLPPPRPRRIECTAMSPMGQKRVVATLCASLPRTARA
eukprot:12546956-Prorocentrum_lima.AAC.1